MVKEREGINGKRGRKAGCGEIRRRRRSGEGQGFVLYLIRAGLLPVRFRSRRIEGSPTGVQMLGTMAIGKEAIMPDPHEALGEHVEQKPTDRLLGG